MPFPEIDIPNELEGGRAAAIRLHVDRLQAARDRGDLSDTVGCAKELAESVARIILEISGAVISNQDSFPKLINAAHKCLDRQPGTGLARNEAVRKMAQSAKSLVQDLGQLRNEVGTGHGRPYPPDVHVEHAEIATDAATVWVRWALRRVPALLKSDVGDLLRLLETGTFYRGTLSERLDSIRLDALEPFRARSVGLAIGRRTVGGTFMVRIEGIDPIIERPSTFRADYRLAVLEGLLFDPNGALSTTPAAVELVVDLLLVDDDLDESFEQLEPLLSTAGWTTPTGSTSTDLDDVEQAAMDAARRFPPDVRQRWLDLWDRDTPGR